MDDHNNILRTAAEHAVAYCDSLAERPVAVTARYAELVAALDRPLSDDGVDGERVIRELSNDIERGILASSGPRFFGWVCGGTTPTSIAADWLVTVWDQTPGLYQCGPGTAVVEEIAARWLVELLGLPRSVSYGL